MQVFFVKKSKPSLKNTAGPRQPSIVCLKLTVFFESRSGSIPWAAVRASINLPSVPADSVISSATMFRVAMKDFTFSDGVRIPAGTFVCVPLYATHYDDQTYAESSKFDPNRFAADAPEAGATALAEKDGEHRQQQMVTPTPQYLSWGLGRHSWYVFLGQAVPWLNIFYLVSQKKWRFSSSALADGLRRQSLRRCLRILWCRTMSS